MRFKQLVEALPLLGCMSTSIVVIAAIKDDDDIAIRMEDTIIEAIC